MRFNHKRFNASAQDAFEFFDATFKVVEFGKFDKVVGVAQDGRFGGADLGIAQAARFETTRFELNAPIGFFKHSNATFKVVEVVRVDKVVAFELVDAKFESLEVVFFGQRGDVG